MQRLRARSAIALISILTANQLTACRAPATAIVVQFVTEVPAARPVEVNVRVGTNESSGWSTRIWQRGVAGSMDPALSAGLNSFTVFPKEGAARDGSIVVIFDVSVYPGMAGDIPVQFRRRLHLTFTPNRTQTVRVLLPLRCAERSPNCPPGDASCTIGRLCEMQGLTCGDDATCVNAETTTTLFDFDGGTDPDAPAPVHPPDGSAMDAPQESSVVSEAGASDAAMMPEACTPNCNDRQCGSDGCMGSCGTCPDRPNAGATCDITGTCNYGCAAGFADCDVNIVNGCETSLNSNQNCGACGTACSGATPNCDPMTRMCSSGCGAGQTRCGMSCVNAATDVGNCGMCGRTCSFANATATCTAGNCTLGACAQGYANCDGNAANGCETALGSAQNCGGCGQACSGGSPFCDARMGVCTSGCSAPLVRCGGSCVDTVTDLNNCSACGQACAPRANSAVSCMASACRYTCNAGFGDCDGNAANGCETPLSTTTNCGRCGNACSAAHATSACVAGACAVGGCDSGWGNCDGNAANGCETQLNSTTNCGSCGSNCARANATASCAGGSCVIGSCNGGSGNCDATDANGCEAPLNSLSNCGGCGVACSFANASASCGGGSCTLGACNAGFGNCDGNAANGCETPLNSLANCGGCGVGCSLANATATCAGGTCALGACNANFGNCDGNAANGCETSLLVEGNCGGCGVTCTAPRACQSGVCTCSGRGGCTGPGRFCCEPNFATCSCDLCINQGANCP